MLTFFTELFVAESYSRFAVGHITKESLSGTTRVTRYNEIPFVRLTFG